MRTNLVTLPRAGLYAITNGPRTDLLDRVETVLANGAALLQYRDKTADHSRHRDEASALLALCRHHRAPLIINDDIELAMAVGAAGVHLGEHDDDIATARAQLGPQAIIGVSCYDSLERARQLAAAGVDYLAFGSFFPSPTKPAARSANPELLRNAKTLGLPLVAIGGITPENAPVLIAAGADFLAVISGVFNVTDSAAATRRYAALLLK